MTEYLKIKDGVDLQELEKFNYCDMGNCYQRHLDFGVILFVNKSTRIMSRVAPYDCRDIPSNSEIDEIAGLVEKVVVK